MDTQNEIIARAVIICDGKLLLVHRKGASNTFLPGGHIEEGETAAAALERELVEEIGPDTGPVGRFLAVVEHRYINRNMEVTEINLLFETGAGALDSGKTPVSPEAHLGFRWVPCTAETLAAQVLEPWILRDNLPIHAQGGNMPPFLGTIKVQ